MPSWALPWLCDPDGPWHDGVLLDLLAGELS
jgi:hypothetical protein